MQSNLDPTLQEMTDKLRDSQIEEGVICAICNQPFREEYGRVLACGGCGGDGVLDGDDDE